MEWNKLISARRLGMEASNIDTMDERSEFLRDYDRLIFSAPFRRLQNKTQVFPLPGSVFVHNRLTFLASLAPLNFCMSFATWIALLLGSQSGALRMFCAMDCPMI